MKSWKAMGLGLVAVGMVAGCKFGGGAAREMQLLGQAKQSALACIAFAGEHADALPASPADLAACVETTPEIAQFDLVAKGKLSEVGNPMTAVLLKSKALTSSGKRAVAYADGHCELVAEP